MFTFPTDSVLQDATIPNW